MTPPPYRWRADTQMAVAEKKDIMAHKKCMVEQGLKHGVSSRSHAGAAAGVGMV